MSAVCCLCHILNAFFEFMKTHGGFGSGDDNESMSTERKSHPPPKPKRISSKRDLRRYDEADKAQ